MVKASAVLAKAKSYVKTSAYPNPNEFTKWYGFGSSAQPWCAVFVYFVLSKVGGKELMAGCSNRAYCPTIWTWADRKGYTLTRKSTARPGDLAVFDWDKNVVPDHIGFVIKDNGNGTIETIEGNTSNANRSNGGCVQIKTRKKEDLRGFVRLPYLTEEDKKPYQGAWWTPVLTKGSKGYNVTKYQRYLYWAGIIKKADIDGSFGPATEEATKKLQKLLGFTGKDIDGSVGPATTKRAKSYLK